MLPCAAASPTKCWLKLWFCGILSLVTNITLSLPYWSLHFIWPKPSCHPPVTFPYLSPRGYFALEWPAHFAAKGGGRALGAISASKSGSTQVESSLSSPWLMFSLLNQNQKYIQYLQQQWIWSDAWIIHINNRPTTSWEAVGTVDDPTPSPRLFVASVFPPPLTSLDWPEKVNPQGHGSLGSKNGEGGVSSLMIFLKTFSDHMNIKKMVQKVPCRYQIVWSWCIWGACSNAHKCSAGSF